VSRIVDPLSRSVTVTVELPLLWRKAARRSARPAPHDDWTIAAWSADRARMRCRGTRETAVLPAAARRPRRASRELLLDRQPNRRPVHSPVAPSLSRSRVRLAFRPRTKRSRSSAARPLLAVERRAHGSVVRAFGEGASKAGLRTTSAPRRQLDDSRKRIAVEECQVVEPERW